MAARNLTDANSIAKVKALQPVADELGCTVAQLAIGWCLKNPNVSSVITGASRVSQVHENLKAAEVAAKLTSDYLTRIDVIMGNNPNED